MTLARWSIVAAIQTALTLLLLETVGRLFDPLGISYYPETARYLDTMIREEPIGYRHRPRLEGTFYGAPIRINSHGMRDREVDPNAPGEFSVLVVGDSVPFGIGVTYEDSIPHQLERILNATAPSGRTNRTLNMGVPSYNTEQQLLAMGEYRPDSPRWHAIDRSLSEIRRHCEGVGVPFMVFTRFFGAVTKAFQLLVDVGRREGFPVVDLAPWTDARWKNEDPLHFSNSRVDNHPNAVGSHVYAVLLAESLHRVGVLSPADARAGRPLR